VPPELSGEGVLVTAAALLAAAERNGGSAESREVYGLARRLDELLRGRPRTERALLDSLRRLERLGLARREIASLGRYGRRSVWRPLPELERLASCNPLLLFLLELLR
jgi:Cdc6-like AAA superfamily ATPase